MGFGNPAGGADFLHLANRDVGITVTDEDEFGVGNFAADDLGGFEAVHARHRDVEEDEFGAKGAGFFDGVQAIDGFVEIGGDGSQESTQIAAHGLVVVDDENFHRLGAVKGGKEKDGRPFREGTRSIASSGDDTEGVRRECIGGLL